VKIRLTNYNTRPVKQQLGQIVNVTKRHLILFPGILLQGASITALVPILPTYATKVVGVSTVEYTRAIIIGCIGCTVSMLFLSRIIDKHWTSFMYGIIFSGFVLYTLMISTSSIITHITIAWGLAFSTALMSGILLPAWSTFMASHIHMDEKEETWWVFNSVQGFGSMIGPLVGGLITEFSKSVNNTFYFSALVFLFLAIFYGIYFVKNKNKHQHS